MMSASSGSPAVRTFSDSIRLVSCGVSGAIFFSTAPGAADPAGGRIVLEMIQLGDTTFDGLGRAAQDAGDVGDAAVAALGRFEGGVSSAVFLVERSGKGSHSLGIDGGQFDPFISHP